MSTAPNGKPQQVTLADGRSVDSADPAWREECLVRHRHVTNMRSMDRLARNDYVERVARHGGAELARRLKLAYGDDFERRKAAQQDLLRSVQAPRP